MLKKDIYRISTWFGLINQNKEGISLPLTNCARLDIRLEKDCILGWSSYHHAFISRGDAINIYASLYENDELKKQYVFQKTDLCANPIYQFIKRKDVNNNNPFFKEVADSHTFINKPIDDDTQKLIRVWGKTFK